MKVTIMEKASLNDQHIFPTPEILQKTLGKRYAIFETLMAVITDAEFDLIPEWRYYKDGGWLCKVVFKKKTIFWLSVWDSFFTTSFHFAEKAKAGVMALPIDETLKNEFAKSTPAGKLVSVLISVTSKKQLKDVLTLIRYKKELK